MPDCRCRCSSAPTAGAAVLRLAIFIHCGGVSISLTPSSVFPSHSAPVQTLRQVSAPTRCWDAPVVYAYSRLQCAALRGRARTSLRERKSRHDSDREGLNSTALGEGRPQEEMGMLKRIRRWPIFVRRFDRDIVSMAIPSYTAVMLDPIATIIDVSFIGRLPESTLSLGGMGISNTILNYFGFTFFFIVITTTTTLAQTLAQAAVVTATARRVGQRDSSGDRGDGGELEAKKDAGEDVTMAGSLWGTPRAGGALRQDVARSGARDKDGRRQDVEEADGDDERVDVDDVSEEGKAAGSRVIAGAMIVATSMGVVSAALSWHFAPQLVAFVSGGKDMALVPYAVAYMRNKCLGIPAMVLFFSIIGAYRGYRDLTTPLIGNFLSSVCKVGFGYAFLFHCGMGVAGAGLADALARYCSCLALLALLVRDGRLRLPDLARLPGKKLVLDLVAPGGMSRALTIRKVIEQLCFTASIRLSASYGSAAVASTEVVRQIWSLLSVLWWPMSVAGQTLVAGLLAEWAAIRRVHILRRARSISVRIMAMTTTIGVLGGLSVFCGRFFIPTVMTSNPLIQDLCSQQLPVVALIMPISALCDMTESVFIAAKCYDVVLKGMTLGAMALCGILYAGHALGWGLPTMWIGLGTLFFVRVVISLWLFNSSSSPIPKLPSSSSKDSSDARLDGEPSKARPSRPKPSAL